RLVARQHGLAKGVLNTLKIDFDLIADLEIGLPSGPGKFPKRHTSFGLQTDIDDGKFLFDADDLSLDDGTFLKISAAKAFVEQFGEVFRRGCCSGSHGVSCLRCAGGWNGVPNARAEGPADLRRPLGIQDGRRKIPCFWNDGSVRRALRKGSSGASVLQH